MAHFLVQLSYTPAALAAQVHEPQDRPARTAALFEQLGGRVEAFYYALGTHDVVAVCELPDTVSAVALRLAVTAGGAIAASTITPLLPVEDGLRAMRQAAAAASAYRPPTG